MHFDRKSAEWSILYFSGHRWNFLYYYAFLSCRLVVRYLCDIANSVDSDKTSHCVTLHLDLHCLSKYRFASTVNLCKTATLKKTLDWFSRSIIA